MTTKQKDILKVVNEFQKYLFYLFKNIHKDEDNDGLWTKGQCEWSAETIKNNFNIMKEEIKKIEKVD